MYCQNDFAQCGFCLKNPLEIKEGFGFCIDEWIALNLRKTTCMENEVSVKIIVSCKCKLQVFLFFPAFFIRTKTDEMKN